MITITSVDIQEQRVGKGYISYMKDDKGNSAEYDFVLIRPTSKDTFFNAQANSVQSLDGNIPLSRIEGSYNNVSGMCNTIVGNNIRVSGNNNQIIQKSSNCSVSGNDNKLNGCSECTVSNCNSMTL